MMEQRALAARSPASRDTKSHQAEVDEELLH